MTDDAEGGSDDVVTVFAASDGSYYTDWELDRLLQAGTWTPCIRQFDPDRRLVGTERGQLLSLVPIDPAELPARTELRLDGGRTRVVDGRRPSLAPMEAAASVSSPRRYGRPDGP